MKHLSLINCEYYDASFPIQHKQLLDVPLELSPTRTEEFPLSVLDLDFHVIAITEPKNIAVVDPTFVFKAVSGLMFRFF